jgi:hypothetical protein
MREDEMIRRTLITLALGTILAIGFTGCKVDESVGYPSYNEENCGFSLADESCQECLEYKCCNEALDCAYNEDCNEFIKCGGDCDGDQACQQECISNYADGVDDALDYSNCLDFRCASACGFENAGPKCGGFEAQSEGCNNCIQTECCDEGENCAATANCIELFDCVGACGSDQGCVNTCANMYPNAIEAHNAWVDCYNTQCAVACS